MYLLQVSERFEKLLTSNDISHRISKIVHEFVEILIESPEKLFLALLDIVFSPKLILRQLMLIGFLQVSVMTSIKVSRVLKSFIRSCTHNGRQIKRYYSMMENCRYYSEWKEIAKTLDDIRGLDVWRAENSSLFYDAKVILQRIKDTKDMKNRGDIFNLMFRLRGGISRDQFGIQHEGLFTRAYSGTKLLVENYHETITDALNFICDSSSDDIPTDVKLAFFNETRHAYGRTAILLSGGAYLGYYHMGVMKCLWKENLLPRVISGASAGSLMAAVIGTRSNEEMDMLYDDNCHEYVEKRFHIDFFKFSNTIRTSTGKWIQHYTPKFLRFLTDPILSIIFNGKLVNLDNQHFQEVVRSLIGPMTFQEAFDYTGRIINITVAPLNNYDAPRLLNYLTAPHVCVWSAAVASCALPGVFDSFPLIVKEPNGNFSPENIWTRQEHNESEVPPQCYSDGSVENDLPMKQLSELFNVNHFIVSQVNPHSAMLSSLTLQDSVWSPPLYGAIVSYVKFLRHQCRDWLKNVVHLMTSRSLSPQWSIKRGISQALVQEYEGGPDDITVFPWVGHISVLQAFLSILRNPTFEEYYSIVDAGARSMWPFVARIRAQCQVEMTLDQCVQRLRRVVETENVGPSGSKKTSMDRTPSFYTTRSIVNLSGLSVSDPLPENVSQSAPSHRGSFASTSSSIPSRASFEKRDRGYSLTGESLDVDDAVEVNHSETPEPSPRIKKTTSMAKFYYQRSHSEEKLNEKGN